MWHTEQTGSYGLSLERSISKMARLVEGSMILNNNTYSWVKWLPGAIKDQEAS